MSLFLSLYFWDVIDVTLMSLMALILFLCRYPKTRDAIVGTALFIGMIFQIYETLSGGRISSPSDVYADLILLLVIFASGGNIMSIVVIGQLQAKVRSIWLLIKRPFISKVK